ncbi:MAG: hypothetical protein EPN62_11115 [Candidimonas sp.]|nr:MAG: hypothetical protein EPN77_03040 [Candidimonas sp.]TAM22761.1 MAG: hypothetical protein EPN62_11115 [Candidimonas sp.]
MAAPACVPLCAFRSLLGIAEDVTTPTYAELYAAKSQSTTSSGRVWQPGKHGKNFQFCSTTNMEMPRERSLTSLPLR